MIIEYLVIALKTPLNECENKRTLVYIKLIELLPLRLAIPSSPASQFHAMNTIHGKRLFPHVVPCETQQSHVVVITSLSTVRWGRRLQHFNKNFDLQLINL